MNYFNMTVADDGVDFQFEGDVFENARRAGQALADNPLLQKFLLATLGQSLYCDGRLSESVLEELFDKLEWAQVNEEEEDVLEVYLLDEL